MNFYKKKILRREVLQVGLTLNAVMALSAAIPALGAINQGVRKPVAEFDVLKYGAASNGKTLDTKAIQEAVDAAAALGKQSRVIVCTGHKYLIGTIELNGSIEFHLEGNAELLESTNPDDYTAQAAVFVSKNALTISGTGSVNGRALEFMSHYDQPNEWRIPKDWRPKLFILTSGKNSDPWWGLREAISLTAILRNPETKVGAIRDVVIWNIRGKAENSVRINGCKESWISNLQLENVAVMLTCWTACAGNLFDNRPTTAYSGIEQHGNPGYYIRFADLVRLKDCSVEWG